MEYFKRFAELKPAEEHGLTVKPFVGPKMTVVMTYEQVLFEIAPDIETAELHRRLRKERDEVCRRNNEAWQSWQEEIEKSHEVRMLRDKPLSFDDASKAINRIITEYEREGAFTRDDVNIMESMHQERIWNARAEEIDKIIGEMPVKMTAESPMDNLLVYGVLAYTENKNHDMTEQKYNRPCIRFLTEKLLEDIAEFNNSEIGEIIVFSGLHGREEQFFAAQRIEQERGLPKGIVKIYSTGYVKTPSDIEVMVLKRERDDIEKAIEALGMPKHVTRAVLPGGRTIGHILDIMRKGYAW